MLHIKHVPVAEKPVKHTFNIKRFSLREIPGWQVVRMCGRFWQFPPIGESNFPRDMIERTISDPEAIKPMVRTMGAGRSTSTRTSQGAGVYWTGQHAFVRQQFHHEHLKTELVVGKLPKGEFRGIKVTCSLNGHILVYLLVTDKLVDERTFYKYLYFYPKYVSRKWFGEKNYIVERLPYSIDMRLSDATEDSFEVVETF